MTTMTNPKMAELFRKAAREEYAEEGTIEIDDNAVVSFGDDDGAYVAAWVWVHASECDDCKAKVPSLIGCPDGAEICQECFDKGAH